MTHTPDRQSWWRRTIRLLLVVVPLVFLGFYLGVLRAGPRKDLPPLQVSPPPVRLEVLSAEGAPLPPAEAKGIPADANLRVNGDEMNRLRLETTTLPLKDALAAYDRAGADEGWTHKPALSRSLAHLAGPSLIRAYLRESDLRIVILGPPLTANTPERPVTIFEGLYRTGRGRDHP